MYSSKSPGGGSHLFVLALGTTHGFAKNAALDKEDDVLAVELLLKLTNKFFFNSLSRKNKQKNECNP